MLARMEARPADWTVDSLRRDYLERVAGSLPTRVDGVLIEDGELGGVPVRIYRPDRRGDLAAHLYFHSGAFVVGSAFDGVQDAELATRARDADCVVFSVEYRLAPEHRFPAALEDCFTAAVALRENAADAQIDPRRISVGGASAGGNLAAGLSILTRERGGPEFILQLLEIVSTDMTMSSFAWRHPQVGHDVDRDTARALQALYYSDLRDEVDPHISPLHAPDLRGVAPAYVMSAEFDPRRDECEAFVLRLRDAGVAAVASTGEGHIHGSHTLRAWGPAVSWRAEANRALKAANAGEPRAAPLGYMPPWRD
jgi:acetyl esterase